MTVRLWLLRAPTLATDEGPAELGYTKPFLLLSYLALQQDWVTRDHLATLFWPDALTATARRNLRRLISRLREVPGSDGVEVQPDRLRWQVKTDVHE